MSHLRAALRLLAFLLWSSVSFVGAALAIPMVWLSPRIGVPYKRFVCRAWARGLATIVGLRIRVEGTPPWPPFILVSNHLSYLDIVTVMSQAPAVFVAKSEVARWPFLGPLSRVANTIFVDRTSRRDVVRVNALIKRVLVRGEGIVMFPEGTSSRGAEVLPFRSSLLQPAVQAGRPVSHASVSYTTPRGAPPAEFSVCWWGDMTFGRHFYNMLRLPSIEGSIAFGTSALQAATRQELANDLHRAVTETFTPVTEAASPRPATS